MVKNSAPSTDYRYGYQGDFAEEDKETGFNHFELREYDPVIGRWMNVDPYRQYYSGYVGMGNNPVMGVDPDGGFNKEWKANFYNFMHGGNGQVVQQGNEWGVYS
jgi:RHS repeat-associated protein